MKIAVETSAWLNQRGYGRHIRALLRALVALDEQNQYVFFHDSSLPTEPFPSGVDLCQVRASEPASLAAAADGRRSLNDMWQMSKALAKSGCDLILFPTVYSFVPVASAARKVVVIHDAIPEKFPILTLPSRSARFFWNTKVYLARKQADALVTVSDFSKTIIVEHFNLDPEQVYVVGEASDPIFRRLENPHLTDTLRSLKVSGQCRLIIYLGGFGPHKNIEVLLNVFAQLAGEAEFADLRLVLVGEFRKEVFYSTAPALEKRIQELRMGERVIFTGYLPDDELVVLLNIATVLVLPSLMEGFGLPAVEAAACGCPVIATTASPLPELLDGGGLYFNPYRPDELEQALLELLRSSELRARMRASGLQAAGSLTWEKAGLQMKEVLEKVAAG